jgi:hypothetical protein
MKIAVVSESPIDEAAIKILVDKIVGSESELASLRARSDGWTKIFEILPGIINTLHYGTEVEALVVVVDSDESPPHQESHDQSQSSNPDCRLCRLRDTVRVVLEKAKPMPNRPPLKTALGLAVPAIEAWYRCGVDTHVNEVAWGRKLRGEHVGYDRRSLKQDTYGSSRPNPSTAVEAATRIASNLELLEQLFPNGFGSLLRDVRRWSE